jgi:hypothetical protein
MAIPGRNTKVEYNLTGFTGGSWVTIGKTTKTPLPEASRKVMDASGVESTVEESEVDPLIMLAEQEIEILYNEAQLEMMETLFAETDEVYLRFTNPKWTKKYWQAVKFIGISAGEAVGGDLLKGKLKYKPVTVAVLSSSAPS